MASYKIKTTGRRVLTEHRAFRPLVISAAVGGKSTSGTYIRTKGPDEHETRTAGENVIILRYWAKHGRNVIFLEDADETKGRDLWKRACEAAINGDESILFQRADDVAQIQIDAIRRHVNEGRRARGKVKPIKESTAKRKERETGRSDLPVLVRTGQLMESLRPYVRRLKR